ncbi:MAG: dihydrolipoamide acetyltransferase component of pyruvate dehydrogenase complex [Acidimicrobiia bacterium]|nr:MAG: dihydrolipoamide acetyltransferase component of pyruvate dehydrogenase complex [Acidimicrobiia bacterium]
MAQTFRLPDIGEGLTEAEVVRWLVGVGDRVEVDQPVVEVETDKAVVEIPCPYAGVVLHLGAAEGETISVGEVLVVVGEEGETWPPDEAEAPPVVGTLPSTSQTLPTRTSGGDGRAAGRVKALPVVRRLARELGVDLAEVEGSGPGGRITREDVLAAAETKPAEEPAEAAPLDVEPAREPIAGRRVRMSNLRRVIARNMVRSWREIPHVTTFDEVDATRLLEARRALQRRHGEPIPLDALLVKAVLPVLDEFPDFEAVVDGDDLVYPDTHRIGVAVDTPEGLMVVVVPETGRLPLLDLARRITQLAEGARNRTLDPDQLTGQTFTVSNIGALGGGHGTPIVPPGTTAILSVGRANPKPIARDAKIEIAPMMPLSLSYDHRVIDGGQGRRFIARLIENLEEPALFLV